jgi:hypothetical protein
MLIDTTVGGINLADSVVRTLGRYGNLDIP